MKQLKLLINKVLNKNWKNAINQIIKDVIFKMYINYYDSWP